MAIFRWRGWLWVGLGVLNVALFLPFFLTQAGHVDVLPFTPRTHPHGEFGFNFVSVVEYVKALFLRRPNTDVFRLSLEFAGLLVVTGLFRDSRRTRAFASVLYVAALVLLAYHHAYRVLYRVEPALWEDLRLLPSLLRYISSVTHFAVPMALLGAFIGLCFVLWRGVDAVLTAWQKRVTSRSFIVVGVLFLWGCLSTCWFGVDRNDPVVQMPSKALAANFRMSLHRRHQWASLHSIGADDSYRLAQRAQLERRPRVYLLMLEAYGQRLVSDPELKGPFERLAQRAQEHLSANGYSMRTAFSAAPVYGGRSWLSVATVQTGVRIDAPSIYDEMSPHATQLATITEFFRSKKYRTLALLPGNYLKDLPPEPYRRDEMLDYLNLGYTGQHYGYVGVPDQFSLRAFRSRILDKQTEPFFAFYLSISSHHPFPEIPFEATSEWLPIDGVDAIVSPMHRPYFKSIEYQWRTLLEFIDTESSDDAVFFLVGDHQPLLERTIDDAQELAAEQSLNTPVHVISRNKAFVERFEKFGFLPGLFAPAGTGALRHEGLQSLFIQEFVGEYGGVAEQRFSLYYPDGLGLGALVAPRSGDVGAGADGNGAGNQEGP